MKRWIGSRRRSEGSDKEAKELAKKAEEAD